MFDVIRNFKFKGYIEDIIVENVKKQYIIQKSKPRLFFPSCSFGAWLFVRTWRDSNVKPLSFDADTKLTLSLTCDSDISL